MSKFLNSISSDMGNGILNLSKSYKFRLLPNDEQLTQCAQFAGCCRFVWNHSLARKIEAWKESKKSISAFDLNNQLIQLKSEYEWLKDAPSQALQQVNKDLDQAFKNFFRRVKKGETPGFPKFKKKGVQDAFRFPQGIKLLPQLSKKTGLVKLPKLGEVKFRLSRKIDSRIRNVTVSKTAGHWYIAFNCEIQNYVQEVSPPVAVGIDRGVEVFAMCSDGKALKGRNSFKNSAKKLARLQRRLARKKKFSKNWNKQKKKIERLHHRTANVRKDRLHYLSTQLAKSHSLVVLEKLKTANMTRSAKGDMENPGQMVKQKAGLNRVILDQGWHMFKVMLDYKLAWRGGELREVDPKFTSQTCSLCGYVSNENRKSQSKFVCECCGHRENADLNAARNILAEGLSVSACGGAPVGDPVKQETSNAKGTSCPIS